MLKATRILLMVMVAIVATLGQQSAAIAKTGSVRIQLYKAGFIVGVSGGSGLLTLGGRRYPLSIGGVSLGATVGASRADLVGRVYNINDPADIEGTYSAV